MRKLIYENKSFFFNGLHNFQSKCGVEVYQDHHGFFYVIFTDLEDNPGTSITNAITIISTLIYNQCLNETPIEDIIFVEHYSYPGEPETYDIAELEYNGKKFLHPKWRRVSFEDIFVKG